MTQSRLLKLNKNSFDGEAVVYVMSRDQRIHDNHALLEAQAEAIEKKVPLYVLFNLRYIKNRSREHYEFMLDGLEEISDSLKSHNIRFILTRGAAVANILNTLRQTKAESIYFDFSPLNYSRKLAKKIASEFSGSTYVVDTHNVIPVWLASDKQEFAAHTMRRKVHAALENYLKEPGAITKHPHRPADISGISFAQAKDFIAKIPRSGISISAKSGEKAAHAHLKDFVSKDLDTYATGRNDIANDQQSGLSPYLHFGQISSMRVALDVIGHVKQRPLLFDQARLASAGDTTSEYDGMNALLEEMIVRKELSDNFCFYQTQYKSLKAAPDWAAQSLAKHESDPREFLYTRKQWENAQTHDESWNAAQNQLRQTGKIHGYMRMYWAKKMLEWSKSPQVALADCIYLNDKYSIDGGDPNGYVGILWSITGLHDRPWTERSVYGKIRYMNEGGLKRKYDVAAYHKQWNSR